MTCSPTAEGHATGSSGACGAMRQAQQDGRHSRTTCSAFFAIGVNLRGCETPNRTEPQTHSQFPRSTTLMPTPKGTAEQCTSVLPEHRGEIQDSKPQAEPKWRMQYTTKIKYINIFHNKIKKALEFHLDTLMRSSWRSLRARS